MRQRLVPGLTVAAVVVAAALIAMGTGLGADYANPSWIGNDAASPSIEALMRLDLHGFVAEQPMMGSFSLVLRAPFAALSSLGGHHKLLLEYRFGAFVCVLALGALALVALRLADARRPASQQLLIAGLVMAGPLTFKALFWGHPEELLAAALAVGGVIAAPRRPLLAGALIGLAIATKQWAWLALVPALATTPQRRLKMVAVAGAVALVWALPMALGDLHRFVDQTRAAGHTGAGVTPSSVWWPLNHMVSTSPVDGHMVRTYTVDAWVAHVAEPLVLGVCLALSAAYWRIRRERPAVDAIALLALLLLVRCMLDPLAISYHNAPFAIALAVWETLRRRGLPYVTLAANGGILLTSQLALQPDVLNAVYLAWAVPVAVYLGLVTLGPRGPRAALAPVAA
ncbi:MAG: glycosyltransferase 87 family protein [Thermoleophilaceae bacterium]